MTDAETFDVPRRPFRVTPRPANRNGRSYRRTRDRPARREERAADPTEQARRFAFSAVDGVFGLLVLGTAIVYFRMTNGFFFWADDWSIAYRDQSLSDLLEPYNKHLSLTILGLYRILYELFGFETYLPWRIAGVLAFLSVPIALYFVLRRRTGPLIAAIVASYILWFPNASLLVSALNHWLALLGGVVAAWAFTRRDRTGDLVVATALAFSLCAAGGGIGVAAACFVYAACTRARLWRWVAIVAPSLLWGIWFVMYSSSERAGPFVRLDAEGIVRKTLDGVLGSFEALAFNSRSLGIALAVLFAIHLVWRCIQGLSAAANALAWSTAVVVWWGGLAYSRGAIVRPDNMRYAYVAAVFLVLACIPPTPLRLPAATRSAAAAGVALLVFGFVVVANHGGIADTQERIQGYSRSAQTSLAVINLGPRFVPDAHTFPISLGNGSTAADYRHAVDRWGTPFGTSPENVDEQVVHSLGIDLQPDPVPETPCTAPNQVLAVPARSTVHVQSGATPAMVRVSRFDASGTDVGELAANSSATLDLPDMASQQPWTVGGVGLCISVESLDEIMLSPESEPGAPCTAPNQLLSVPASSTVRVQSGATPVMVRIGRFDSSGTDVGVLAANSSATLELPAMGTQQPWTVGGVGLCVSIVPPETG